MAKMAEQASRREMCLSVECPMCGARKGERCRTLQAGKPTQAPHRARRNEWTFLLPLRYQREEGDGC